MSEDLTAHQLRLLEQQDAAFRVDRVARILTAAIWVAYALALVGVIATSAHLAQRSGDGGQALLVLGVGVVLLPVSFAGSYLVPAWARLHAANSLSDVQRDWDTSII